MFTATHHRLPKMKQLAAAPIVAGLALLITAPLAGAQDQSSQASTTQTVTEQRCTDVAFDGRALIAPNISTRPAAAAALPAGTVTVANATSSDSYVGRENVTQTSEQWDLQFLDAGGAVIATSAPTPDLPDMVQTASWSGSLGPVNLPSDAVSVRPHHRPDIAPDSSPNSVFPGAVRLCWSVEVEVVVTLPPTTAIPETTAPETTVTPTTATPTTVTPTTITPTTATPTTGAPETTVTPTTTATQVLDLTESPTTQPSAPAAVKSATASQGTAELARTGFGTDLIVLIGASLLSFGAALAYLARRNEFAGY